MTDVSEQRVLGAPDDAPVALLRLTDLAEQVAAEVRATDLAEYDATLDAKFQARAEAQIRAAADAPWNLEHETERAMLERLGELKGDLGTAKAAVEATEKVASTHRDTLAELPPAPTSGYLRLLRALLVILPVLATAGVTVVLTGSVDTYVLHKYLASAEYAPNQITTISLVASALIATCVIVPLALLTLGTRGRVGLRSKLAYLLFAEVLFAVAFALIRSEGGASGWLGTGWALFEIAIVVAYTLAVAGIATVLDQATGRLTAVRRATTVAERAMTEAAERRGALGALESTHNAQLAAVAQRQEAEGKLSARIALARETVSLAYWLTVLELQGAATERAAAETDALHLAGPRRVA